MSEHEPQTTNDKPQTAGAPSPALPRAAGAGDVDSVPAPEAPLSPIDQIRAQDLEARITEVLRTVYDPEIPVNVFDLGLIYSIDADPAGDVEVTMTLTSPMCPVAGSLPPEVERKVKGVDGVKSARVNLVWDPPWSAERMSEEAKLQLGIMY